MQPNQLRKMTSPTTNQGISLKAMENQKKASLKIRLNRLTKKAKSREPQAKKA